MWVLTVAHCVVNDPKLAWDKEIVLKMGAMNPQTRHADKIIPHHGYRAQNKLDDIALVRLNNSFDLTTEVGIVELDRINVDHYDVIVTVATSGSTEEESLNCMNSELSILNLPLMSAADCRKIYSSMVYNHHFLNNKVNCVGFYGDSSCNGDAADETRPV
ncbi:Trypsin [Popillia japonica]|uniref:Trypsin n=1 Tax=Popillia japonica TaxID=7064 RepID=A0AAW1IY87_POPJA